MGCKSWSSAARPCDSCKAAPAAAFCRADSAFLCTPCDASSHGGASAALHPRVPVCEVCEQAPAAVTCRADSAALCRACDADVHSANPLARRHERVPVEPTYGAAPTSSSAGGAGEEASEAEAEAASWLLPDPNRKLGDETGSPEYKSTCGLFGEMDPDLGLDLVPGKQKTGRAAVAEEKHYSADGVVPVQGKNEYGSGQYPGLVVDGFPAYEVGYYNPGSLTKPIIYNFTSQSISQSVDSPSLDVGVVPDHTSLAEISDAFPNNTTIVIPTRLSAVDREARVLRYKEKRKNRKFEKTIRYASRKAYAETRPRVKGRFAKRSENEVITSYGVVPNFLKV
ncbi:zinc finger protein CONSTANS [Striga asiatica]|uniref:Zinc finger protein CONSTANS n=1 Tax=Striga asiatica TaxID=4170 RepID=A0A5A7PJI7_STRAF|nr:zinc finger protein CONSTANS [Striga asiatica]